jgi:hypothetical protein
MDNNLNRKTSEIPAQASSDSAEPRRSNRKIQPTSRVQELSILLLNIDSFCCGNCILGHNLAPFSFIVVFSIDVLQRTLWSLLLYMC